MPFWLVMALLTFDTTDFANRNTIPPAALDLIVVLFVNAVELITVGAGGIYKVDFRFPVTVHTPAHTQIAYLSCQVHLLHFSMACLTLNLTGNSML